MADEDPSPSVPAAASSSSSSSAASSAAAPAAAADLDVRATLYEADGAPSLHVRLALPDDAPRPSVRVLLLIDISGSMGSPCALKDGSAEGASFCSLDLVLHAARTLGRVLTSDDSLGIIAFSNAANLAMPPRNMGTASAVEAMDAALATLRPDGMTNVWDAVRMAGRIVDATGDGNTHVLLLTDGAANINPAAGLVPAVHSLLAAARKPWTLHCFGFGGGADTATLQLLAGDAGVLGFIPDASMVGTTFINFAAMLGTLVEPRAHVVLERDGAEPVTIPMGALCAGQPRDAVVRLLPGTTARQVRVRAGLGVPVAAVRGDGDGPADPFLRLRLLAVLEACIEDLTRDGVATVRDARDRLLSLHGAVRAAGGTGGDAFAAGACRDIVAGGEGEGQLSLAPEYAFSGTRWGLHYLRSYASALRHQFRANFKDRALQTFGGARFTAAQAAAAATFDAMPAARPITLAAAAAYVPPASMAAYNNAAGGCFQAFTLIRMAAGGVKPIRNIVRGDVVVTTGGASATVEFVVEYNTHTSSFPLRQVARAFLISPWHPVRDSSDSEWTFPAEREDSGPAATDTHTVYNLVLSHDHVVTLDCGMQAVTLGHGLRGPVVAHPYFGSMAAVMADLECVHGFTSGRPTFAEVHIDRCPYSGTVCGMRDLGAGY